MPTIKNTRKATKTRKKRKYNKKLDNITFYTAPPEITTIDGFKFVFLPLQNNTTRVSCKVFGSNFLESKDNLGISHLLEHILVISYNKCYKSSCYKYLNQYGFSYNATTYNMSTSYYIEGLYRYFDIMLNYLLSIMIDPIFIKKHLVGEIEAVRNEIINVSNKPDYELMNHVNKQVYSNYGMKHAWDFDLQRKNLKKFTVKQLLQFSKLLISKNNVIFFICGQFDKTKTISKIKNILMKISNTPNIPNCIPLLHNKQCYEPNKDVLFIKNTKNNNAIICITFPTYVYYGDPNLIYLPIIAKIMGYGFNSLLLNNLRVIEKLVYNVNVKINTNFCGTIVSINISTVFANVKKVLERTFSIIKKYKHKNIPKDVLKYNKLHYLLKLQSTCLNLPSSVMTHYENQYFYQMSSKAPKIYTIQDITKSVQTLTYKKVSKLIQLFFDTKNCKVCYTLPKSVNFNVHDF